MVELPTFKGVDVGETSLYVGSSPTCSTNTTWTPQVDSVSGIAVWVLGSPERSLINLDVLLRREAVPSKARILKRRGYYVSAIICSISVQWLARQPSKLKVRVQISYTAPNGS